MATKAQHQRTTQPAPRQAVSGKAPGRVLQRSAVSADLAGVEAPPIVHDVLRSPGQPLDDATRAFMEPRFGHDFSHVRVHTDSRAAESSRAVNAHAWTIGNHIAFNAGNYRRTSSEGQHLLAHELTHVVQQRGHLGSPSAAVISPTDTPAEDEARSIASHFQNVRVLHPSAISRAPLQVSRNNGKSKPYVANAGDMAHLQRSLVQILDGVDDSTRRTLLRNKTIVVGLVVDDDGDLATVYTVNGNWTNKQLRQAADKAGVTRWEARPRAEGRGSVGAPGDAEQIMIGAAETNNYRVAGMAVSREVCADCEEAIKSYDKRGIKVVEVSVPLESTRKGKAAPAKTNAQSPTSQKKPKPSPKAPKTAAPRPKVKAPKGITSTRPTRASSLGRGGGLRGAGASAAGAIVTLALGIAAHHYLQGEMDKKNQEAFQKKLEAQQPDIEKMVAGQEAAAQVLERAGKPTFVNVSLYVRYQTDVSGEIGGLTVLMDLKVRKVTVSEKKLEHVTESQIKQGFAEYALKDALGISESHLDFSLSYPDLEMVSLPDPAALPPPTCFIATACYGSPLAPEVQLLRQFRDEWLQYQPGGRTFIHIYYSVSPPIADKLRHHQQARTIVRRSVVAPLLKLVQDRYAHWHRESLPGISCHCEREARQ
jgi:hypothetical protein